VLLGLSGLPELVSASMETTFAVAFCLSSSVDIVSLFFTPSLFGFIAFEISVLFKKCKIA
jgi:hypothetical protein